MKHYLFNIPQALANGIVLKSISVAKSVWFKYVTYNFNSKIRYEICRAVFYVFKIFLSKYYNFGNQNEFLKLR